MESARDACVKVGCLHHTPSEYGPFPALHERSTVLPFSFLKIIIHTANILMRYRCSSDFINVSYYVLMWCFTESLFVPPIGMIERSFTNAYPSMKPVAFSRLGLSIYLVLSSVISLIYSTYLSSLHSLHSASAH